MAIKGYPTKGIKSIVQVRNKKAPVKGAVFVEWDLLFKDAKSVNQKEEVIRQLLTHIKTSVNPEASTKAFTLEFQCFKCDTNDLLYILRVYRKVEKAPAVKKAAISKSGPAKAMAAGFLANDTDSNEVLAFEGPLRPSGPPNPKPPTLQAIVNAVNLPEE